MKINYRFFLLLALTLFFLQGSSGFAAKNQRVFTWGPGFYSGATTSNYSPTYAFMFGYHSNKKIGKGFFFSHRFRVGLAFGEEFGGAGSFYGFHGDYTFGPRLNFGKDGIIPWIDVGPMIAMYAVNLASPPSTTSTNQAAFKYGYSITTGFDKVVDQNSGGWGISVNFFKLLKSPSLFDFPYAKLPVTAVVLEIRHIMESL